MKINIKKYIISIFFCLTLSLGITGVAQAATSKWVPPTLQISIPTITKFSTPTQCGTNNGQPVYCVPWIGEYLAAIYKYTIGIIGIVAAIALMIGGIRWLTAGGNPSSVKDAQSWITGAITGLILGLASYLILYQINPALVQFQPIKVTMVKEVAISSTSSSQYINCKPQIETQCSSGYVSTGNISDCSDVMGNYVGEGMDSTKYQTCCCQVSNKTGCSWQSDSCSTATQSEVTDSPVSSCGSTSTNYHCCCTKSSTTGGECKFVDTGLCAKSNFSSWGSESMAEKASAVCMAESSGSCVCNTDTYSCGPMQLHLGSGGVKDNSGVDCKNYVSKVAHWEAGEKKYNYAWTEWGIKPGYEDKVKSECKAKTCDPSFFTEFSYKEKYLKQGWSAWSVTLPNQKCSGVKS